MTWDPVNSKLTRQGTIHYAWIVLGVTFIGLIVAAAVRSEPGIILKSLEQEFGWSRQSITLAVAVNLLLFGLAGPFLGRLMDVYGPRKVALVTVMIMSAGVSGTVLIRESWHLLVLWGVILGIGSGGMSMVLASSVINRWFSQRRGLALGIAGAAMSAGQLIFTPILMQVTIGVGWRSSVLLIALMLSVIVLPTLWLFLRDSPEQLELPPYGSTVTISTPPKSFRNLMPQVIQSVHFWLLAASFAICGLTTSGLFQTHLIPHGIESGFSEMTMAFSLGLMGATDIIGTIASGWICDVFGKRGPLAIYYLLRGATLIMLPYIESVEFLMIFSVVYGLNWLSTVPATSALAADLFGKENIGVVFGWIFFAHQVGASIAVYGASYLHSWTNNYNVVFMLAGCFAILAAGLVLCIKTNPPCLNVQTDLTE